MKKFTFILATAVLLTACGGSNQSPDSTTKETNKNAEIDNYLDSQLFGDAVNNNDLKSCSKINDKTRQDNCKTIVNDNLFTTEAVEKKDTAICQKIEETRYKEYCENRVKSLLEEENKSEEQNKADEKDLALKNEAGKNQNVEICNKITNEMIKGDCQYNILANQAIKNNDISKCELISDRSKSETCKSIVKTSE